LIPIPVTAILGYQRYFSGVPSKYTGFLPTDSSSCRKCLNRNISGTGSSISAIFHSFHHVDEDSRVNVSEMARHHVEPNGLFGNSSLRLLIVNMISFKLIFLNTDLFVPNDY